jgi:uncharacterized protein YdcH (DUF465 family)
MSKAPEAPLAEVEIDKLRAEHSALERRLEELGRHLTLTPNEQVERASLKKWKLRLKDRISALGGHV